MMQSIPGIQPRVLSNPIVIYACGIGYTGIGYVLPN